MKNRIDFCFLGLIFLAVVYITACSGDDTGIEVLFEPEVEVTQKPEPVEEVIPEPVVETVYVPTLESWGIEDGQVEIINGNCNLPIFKKAPFPHDAETYKIKSESGAMGGPECRDSDPEGSIVDLDCVRPNFLGPDVKVCEGYDMEIVDRCYWEEDNGVIDECRIVYYDLGVTSGYTNFYDDVFRQSISYIDTRGNERDYPKTRSFIMVQTHNGGSLASPSGDYSEGRLYGKYNPDSGEYKDRKALWDACEVGTDPEKGSGKGDNRNGIKGDWQAIKRNGYTEVCIRLDTLPGAVKCFVDDPDNERVKLYTRGNSPKIVVDADEMDDRYLAVPGTIFGNFEFNKLCELFDEG